MPKLLLVSLPPSHLLRRLPLPELLKAYPDAKTVNDLLTLDVSRDLPPREVPITGLLGTLPPKDELRNTPLKDLRTYYCDPRAPTWARLRHNDSRGALTYNQLPPLQRYRFAWKVVSA